MLKNRISYSLVAIILALAVVISGCSKKDSNSSGSAQDKLQTSIEKAADMTSYKFSGSLKFEDFEADLGDSDPDTALGLEILKNAQISWTGAYQEDPQLMEIALKLDLKGDLAINLTIPIVATDKKLWVKVPNAPMLGIPEELVDKYLELDLDQLMEEAGTTDVPQLDPKTAQAFAKDLINVAFKHLEAGEFVSSISAKEAGIPSDAGVKNVVQLHVKKSQLEGLLKTVVEKIAPDVLDMMAKNQDYLDMFELTKEDIDSAKEELANTESSEISDVTDEIKNGLTKLDIEANIGIDKKNYPVYTDATLQLGFDDDTGSGSFSFKVVSQLSNVNEKVKFEYGEPSADDIIPFEDAFGDLGSLMGGMEDY